MAVTVWGEACPASPGDGGTAAPRLVLALAVGAADAPAWGPDRQAAGTTLLHSSGERTVSPLKGTDSSSRLGSKPSAANALPGGPTNTGSSGPATAGAGTQCTGGGCGPQSASPAAFGWRSGDDTAGPCALPASSRAASRACSVGTAAVCASALPCPSPFSPAVSTEHAAKAAIALISTSRRPRRATSSRTSEAGALAPVPRSAARRFRVEGDVAAARAAAAESAFALHAGAPPVPGATGMDPPERPIADPARTVLIGEWKLGGRRSAVPASHDGGRASVGRWGRSTRLPEPTPPVT
jgi:hypothetical protein